MHLKINIESIKYILYRQITFRNIFVRYLDKMQNKKKSFIIKFISFQTMFKVSQNL